MEQRYGKRTLLGQKNNSLVLLLAILTIIFCVFKFVLLVYNFSSPDRATLYKSYYEGIFNWFILPADTGKFLGRPWTILTYMVMHDRPFHLLGNLIWLWVFGYILQDLAGNQKIIPLFIYGGICGGLLFMLCMNVFPGFRNDVALATLTGASAGIMSIAIATTVLAPNYRFFPMINGGIPLWVITIIYLIVDVAMIAENDNAGGHISHIGGALFGVIFMWRLRKGQDLSNGMNRFFDWVDNLFNPEKKDWKKTAREEHHYKTAGTAPYKKVANLTQKRIDEILDKIGEKGYHQLSEEEKQILKRAAEDDNL